METKKVDIWVIMLIILMYCLITFFNIFSKQYYMENLIMLSMLFAIILISYFNGIIAAMITVVTAMFFYGSYVLYTNIILQESVQPHVYFWLIIFPAAAVLSSLIGGKIRDIQAENIKLNQNYSSFVTIDQDTGLNNAQVFFIVLNQYMSLAKRHKLPLTLMLVKLSYFEDIRSIVGENGIGGILKDIGAQLTKSTRMEDCSYILEDGKTFGLLLFTDTKGAQIVKDRIKENISDYNPGNSNKAVSIKIELKVGFVQYNEKIQDAIEYRRLAEKDIEYDV
ncbi:MAG: diguanylate cyclase [Bacillota bacterium]|nr:diguanylate cyclase [Bacillota bacterium]